MIEETRAEKRASANTKTKNNKDKGEDWRGGIDTNFDQNRDFVNNYAADHPKPRYTKYTQVDNAVVTSLFNNIPASAEDVKVYF